jgi:hypothetical protein
MSDKRKFQRYDIDIPVGIEIVPQAGISEKVYFEGINLSAGGMLINKGQFLPESSSIKIEIIFHLEELKTPENSEGTLIMTVTGQVVRTESERTAIRFNEDYEMSRLSFLPQGDKSKIV